MLIKCFVCGSTVSSAARACPNCGDPVASRAESRRLSEAANEESRIRNIARKAEYLYPCRHLAAEAINSGTTSRWDTYVKVSNLLEEAIREAVFDLHLKLELSNKKKYVEKLFSENNIEYYFPDEHKQGMEMRSM